MSAKAAGKVWDLDLPHNKQHVLLAMADHADHEGGNIFPSTDLIAWKTGYSTRQVQRIIDVLITDGILVVVAPARQQRPTTYRVDFSAGKQKAPYERPVSSTETRQNVTPESSQDVTPEGRQNVTSEQSRGDISVYPGVTFETSRGDIAMSPEPWNHGEPPPPEPPTQTQPEQSGGGGEDISYEQDVRTLLGGFKIYTAKNIAAKYAAMPDRPTLDAIRTAVEDMYDKREPHNLDRIARQLMNCPPPYATPTARAPTSISVAPPGPPPIPLSPDERRKLAEKYDWRRSNE